MAAAHPLAPSLLELRELDDGTLAVRWKTPLARPRGAAVEPMLPAHCRDLTARAATFAEDSVTLRWRVDCRGAELAGTEIAVRGLDAAGAALVRLTLSDGDPIRALLRPGAESLRIERRAGSFALAARYGQLGFEHILGGIDHLLFVLGLLLLVWERRPLVLAISAFTAGHSATLALAVLGVVQVPPGPIELAIAASVLVLGCELARRPRSLGERGARASLLRRRPALLSLGFGLLHGLGFAGALHEIGLPAGEIPLALASFNAGIELGQLAFVAAVGAVAVALAAPLAAARERVAPRIASLATQLPAYAIGSTAAYLCLSRAASLL